MNLPGIRRQMPSVQLEHASIWEGACMDVHATVDFYTLDIYSTKYKKIFSVTAVWLHNEWLVVTLSWKQNIWEGKVGRECTQTTGAEWYTKKGVRKVHKCILWNSHIFVLIFNCR